MNLAESLEDGTTAYLIERALDDLAFLAGQANGAELMIDLAEGETSFTAAWEGREWFRFHTPLAGRPSLMKFLRSL